MANKTEEEKAAELATKEAKKEEKRLADEKEAAEIEAESVRVEAEKAAKAEEKRLAREAAKGTENQNRMYSKEEVQAMLKELAADIKKNWNKEDDGMDEEEMYKQKKLRLPRWQNKFITSFKNTNTDEYFPDLVIHAFDIWNDQTKRNDPWVTVVFEDNTTLTVQLYTILTKSQKVWVDLVEVVAKDTSYSTGKVERAEVKDYSQVGTGSYIKQKVTQADYSYKVRLPNGQEVMVGKEVINW